MAPVLLIVSDMYAVALDTDPPGPQKMPEEELSYNKPRRIFSVYHHEFRKSSLNHESQSENTVETLALSELSAIVALDLRRKIKRIIRFSVANNPFIALNM
jgi:hypothetical protein